MATIIFRALGGKENMDKIWPLTGSDEVKSVAPPDKEFWQAVRTKQALIDRQIKEQRNKVLPR